MSARLHVRDILAMDANDVWGKLPKTFDLVFDNGEVVKSKDKTTIFTSYYWDVIRQYPNIEITPDNHLDHILANGDFGSGSHIRLLESFYKKIILAYQLLVPADRDNLNKLIFETNNRAYNELSTRLKLYVASIDILDFIDVATNPKIEKETDKYISNNKTSQSDIIELSENILKIIKTDKSLDNNRLALATRTKIVRANQVVQCVGLRGYPTDVNSAYFKEPIINGYVKGLHTLYESMTESRLASKSLLFATAPLQMSEYLSRRIQILSMSVERIHYTDCGSTKYLDAFITDDEYDEFGTRIVRSNLPLMEGVYYLDERDNQVKPIRATDKHLINKHIKIRSLISGCQHPDRHGVCQVCFGELAQNIQPGANVGHLAGSVLGRIISQLILSVKHYESSGDISYIKLNNRSSKFFSIDKERDKYYINEKVIKDGYSVEISKEALINLNDILNVHNLSFNDISRTSKVETVAFFNQNDYEELDIRVENRLGILSKEFIAYIKEKKWTVNQKFNYVFDISDWDSSKPFIILPKKHYNNTDLSNDIESLIKGNQITLMLKKKEDYATIITNTLWDLFNLVNSKLTVNFSLIQTIVYASMILSDEHLDMRLPRANDHKEIGKLKNIIENRSLSGLFAYEKLKESLFTPEIYFPLWRENYPMDVYIDPQAVIKKQYGI